MTKSTILVMLTACAGGGCIEATHVSAEAEADAGGEMGPVVDVGLTADVAPSPLVCSEEGAVSTLPCGPDGRAVPARCIEGRWTPNGPCGGSDPRPEAHCSPVGAHGSVPCGLNLTGEQRQICSSEGWVDEGICADPAVCRDGTERAEPCGFNGRGRAVQPCAGGRWQAFEPCREVDVCFDGDVERDHCADGLQRERRCYAGQWGGWSPCLGPGACYAGEQADVPCGPNLGGFRSRPCVDGAWGEPGDCHGSGVCVNGAVSREPCGPNGNGYREVVCVAGAWAAHPDLGDRCVDVDECRAGAVEVSECGSDRARIRRCRGGFWGLWGPCEPVRRCDTDQDCDADAVCVDGACGLPRCDDRRRNGDETGVDCGGACPPCVAERCNARDDDRDGLIDEGHDVRVPCEVGEGRCRAEGRRVCAPGGESTACSVRRGPTADETCDGLDEDCDDITDEGMNAWCSARLPGVSRATCAAGEVGAACVVELCHPGLLDEDGVAGNGCEAAACGAESVGPEAAALLGRPCDVPLADAGPGCICAGVHRCVGDGDGTHRVVCSVDAGAEAGEGALTISDCPVALRTGGLAAERCNGIDDDCDGQVDEGFELGERCVVGVGACAREGIRVCDGGQSVCRVDMPPLEVCNAVDDDCDGRVDEDTAARCLEAAGPGVQSALCLDGTCRVALCEPGLEDADLDPTTGCEAARCALPPEERTCSTALYPDRPASRCRCMGLTRCGADGEGACEVARRADGTCTDVAGTEAERCASGEDEDCDGRIDEAACACEDADTCSACPAHIGLRPPLAIPLRTTNLATVGGDSLLIAELTALHRLDRGVGCAWTAFGGFYQAGGVIGGGVVGFQGVSEITDVAVDSRGRVFVALRRWDTTALLELTADGRVRRVSERFELTGEGVPEPLVGDAALDRVRAIQFVALAFDAQDHLFALGANEALDPEDRVGLIFRVNPESGDVVPFADGDPPDRFGYGPSLVYAPDPDPDPDRRHGGYLYAVDRHHGTISEFLVDTGEVTASFTFAVPPDPSMAPEPTVVSDLAVWRGELLILAERGANALYTVPVPLPAAPRPHRIAGAGPPGYTEGYAGPPLDVRLSNPSALAVRPDGAVYIGDWGNGHVVLLTPGPDGDEAAGAGEAPALHPLSRGQFEVVVGNGFVYDIGPSQALDASRLVPHATARITPDPVAVGDDGLIYSLHQNLSLVTVFDPQSRTLRPFFGNGNKRFHPPPGIDPVDPSRVPLTGAEGLAYVGGDEPGLFVSDREAGIVWWVDLVDGRAQVVLGRAAREAEWCAPGPDGESPCALSKPRGLAVDPAREVLFVVDANNDRILEFDVRRRELSTFVGPGGRFDPAEHPSLADLPLSQVSVLRDGRVAVSASVHHDQGPVSCDVHQRERVLILNPRDGSLCVLATPPDGPDLGLEACAGLAAPLALTQPGNVVEVGDALYVSEANWRGCVAPAGEPAPTDQMSRIWRVAHGRSEAIRQHSHGRVQALTWDPIGERLLFQEGHDSDNGHLMALSVDAEGSTLSLVGPRGWRESGTFDGASLGRPRSMAWSEALGGPLVLIDTGGSEAPILRVDMASRRVSTWFGFVRDASGASIGAESRSLVGARDITLDPSTRQVFASDAHGVWRFDPGATPPRSQLAACSDREGGCDGLAFDARRGVLYVARTNGLHRLPVAGGAMERVEACVDAVSPAGLVMHGDALYVAEALRRADDEVWAGRIWRYDVDEDHCVVIAPELRLTCPTPVPAPQVGRGLAVTAVGDLYFTTSCGVFRLDADAGGRVPEWQPEWRPEDRLRTIYRYDADAPPPMRLTRCLTDVRVDREGREVTLLDACTGMLFTVRR